MAGNKVFKFVELNAILGTFGVEHFNDAGELLVSLHTDLVDVSQNFILEEISAVFRVQRSKSPAGPCLLTLCFSGFLRQSFHHPIQNL